MSGYLLDNLVLFGRLLRGLGMDVDPGRVIDLLRALEWVDIGQKEDFYHTARSLFVHKADDLAVFDQAFHAFWQAPGQEGIHLDLGSLGGSRNRRRVRVSPPPLQDQAAKEIKQGVEPGNSLDPPVLQVTRTYSDRERLRRKDFAKLTGDELAAIERLIADLTLELGKRRSRRLEPGPGQIVDFRRTLRRNLKYGGEPLAWEYRQTKEKARPLVILADISGSMERYTRLLLHFIYSLSAGLQQRVEAFVFSTRLTRITRELQGHDVESVFKEVASSVPDWAGGTRIGEALKRFNFDWSRRVLGQGAVVLLISDGWDRGDAGLLRVEIARLQRSCFRLIWLNPLLGGEGYEPLTRGMQTSLPYIDDFLPVHNLASLEALARHLGEIDRLKPVRGQGRQSNQVNFV